jgi:hypothetical protein
VCVKDTVLQNKGIHGDYILLFITSSDKSHCIAALLYCGMGGEANY